MRRTKVEQNNITVLIIGIIIVICIIGYFYFNIKLSENIYSVFAESADKTTVKENTIPNDPFFYKQWALSEEENGICMQEAWKISAEAGRVTVGVMDSGIAIHDDLESNIDREHGYNAIRRTNFPNDTIDHYGHGTAVSGVIGAVTDNGLGMSGIVNDVDIIPLVVVDNFGYYNSDAVVRAIEYAIDQDIKILNFSAERFGDDLTVLNAIKKYKGLFIWSAGNFGKNVDDFENIEEFNLPNLISVGARDKNNQRSYWGTDKGVGSSSYGKAVDIFAPGGRVTKSTDNSGMILTTNKDKGYSEDFGGTSAAAPHVAGVAALLLSANPTMTSAQLKQAIIDGSDMIEIDTPVGKQKVRNLNAYGALHSVGVFSTKAISDTEVAITGLYNVKSDYLMIPATYQGKKVTAIADKAFKNNTMLKSVIISESVTSIGNEAFAGSSVEKVTFFRGEDALKIYDRAFADCDELYEFDVPERVTSIGVEAFADCYNLQKVEIADSLYNRRALTLGDEVFIGCSNLTGMDFPSRVTQIGKSCFQGCTRFKHVFFYRGLNFTLDIGETAFCNTGLLSIEMPYRLRSIGNRAFAECSELTEVKFVDGINKINIGSNAFYNCKKLVSVFIPNTVGSIGVGAFRNCSALSEITLWADFTEISDDLFNGCSALEKVAIYGKITKIGNYAFSQCTSLTNIDLGDYTELQTIGNYAFNGTAIKTANIPNTVNYIGSGAFGNCLGLTSIVLPSGVTEISDELFNGCSNLGQVTINGKITRIGNYAFSQCTSLSTVQFGDMGGLQTIGNHAFDSTLISAIDIPNSVTTIGNYAFAWCTRLTSVGISKDSGLISIGNYAFDNTTISEIYLPDTLTSIGQGAFMNCEFLTSVTLPKNIESIGNGVFYGCVNLREAVMPSGVKSIGEYAFYRCKKLDNIVLPSTLKNIGVSAFEKCYDLSNIVVPNGVEKIEEFAFSGCSSFTEIIIPNTIIQLGSYVFKDCFSLVSLSFEWGARLSDIPGGLCEGCFSLKTVNMPLGVNGIGVCAFKNCSMLEYVPFSVNDMIEDIGQEAFYNCAISEVWLPQTLRVFHCNTFGSCLQLQKIHITNTTNLMQLGGCMDDDPMPFADCPALDGLYVYDVYLAMDYKYEYKRLADRIVTVGFDWALVTDITYNRERFAFHSVYELNNIEELKTDVANNLVNGVLFYLSANETYDLSCYTDIFCYDLPVIVMTSGSVTEDMPYTVIRSDAYSLGYGIAKSYIDGLYDYAGVDIHEILIDQAYFPVITPQLYTYNLSFLMGMSHVFGVPVKAVERYDELYDWKNENDICFENWLCFIDGTNAEIVKLTFNNNIGEYYVSCGFSYSRQYLSEFEYKFVIKNTSVITDIAEKRILGESYDFIDYTFDVDTAWIESNISNDYDHVIIDWYENEWINDDYNVLTEQEIEAEKERYSKILEFYADKSAYITDNGLCYVEQKVSSIEPYIE